MSALALDLNAELSAIRSGRRWTRKEFAKATGIPPHRVEKIERREVGVSLETLQGAAKLPEGKALAARIFQLDHDIQAELHALLQRATQLARGGT